jgi:hypothetical protein
LSPFRAFQNFVAYRRADAAAGDDAFFDGGAGGVHGVVHAVFAFFHFDFGRAADADNGNAASQFGQTFLQLFLVVVGRGFFDLRLDLGDAGFDVLLLARPSMMVVSSLVMRTFFA